MVCVSFYNILVIESKVTKSRRIEKDYFVFLYRDINKIKTCIRWTRKENKDFWYTIHVIPTLYIFSQFQDSPSLLLFHATIITHTTNEKIIVEIIKETGSWRTESYLSFHDLGSLNKLILTFRKVNSPWPNPTSVDTYIVI